MAEQAYKCLTNAHSEATLLAKLNAHGEVKLMNALLPHATKLCSGEFNGKVLSSTLAYPTELAKPEG